MTRRVNNMAMAHTRKASKVSSLLVLKNIPSKKHYCSVPEKKKKKNTKYSYHKTKRKIFLKTKTKFISLIFYMCVVPDLKIKKKRKKLWGIKKTNR